MATRTVEIGEVGHVVRGNVRRVRRQREMTLADVSKLIATVGHPLSKSALSQIENGGRRVDVDDLVALAAVLEIPPAELLHQVNTLPPIAYDESSAREMAKFDALPEAEKIRVMDEVHRLQDLEDRIAELERRERG